MSSVSSCGSCSQLSCRSGGERGAGDCGSLRLRGSRSSSPTCGQPCFSGGRDRGGSALPQRTPELVRDRLEALNRIPKGLVVYVTCETTEPWPGRTRWRASPRSGQCLTRPATRDRAHDRTCGAVPADTSRRTSTAHARPKRPAALDHTNSRSTTLRLTWASATRSGFSARPGGPPRHITPGTSCSGRSLASGSRGTP